ncbi:MAG: type I toxin-antitoxin system SymE family toxin [bacterium]|nr:type I toxin-antitoxin system SymE family toxin [bacterium]
MKENIKPKKKILKLQPKEIVLVNKNKIVPELRLSGIWLQSNGFYEGQQVEVTFGYEYIVIYPYKNEML